MREPRARTCHLVNVGYLDRGITVVAQMVRAKSIEGDRNHIETGPFGCQSADGKAEHDRSAYRQ